MKKIINDKTIKDFTEEMKERLWNKRMTTVEVNLRKSAYKVFCEVAEKLAEENNLPVDPEFVMMHCLHKCAEDLKVMSYSDLIERKNEQKS